MNVRLGGRALTKGPTLMWPGGVNSGPWPLLFLFAFWLSLVEQPPPTISFTCTASALVHIDHRPNPLKTRTKINLLSSFNLKLSSILSQQLGWLIYHVLGRWGETLNVSQIREIIDEVDLWISRRGSVKGQRYRLQIWATGMILLNRPHLPTVHASMFNSR